MSKKHNKYINFSIHLFLLLNLLMFKPLFADEKSFLIAQAMVPYLGTTHVMATLQKSECGYAVSNNSNKYDIVATKKSILKVMRPNDKSSVEIFFKSSDYKKIMQDSKNIANEMLSQLNNSKKDKKTTCGIIAGTFQSAYFNSLVKWNNAVKKYKQ